MLVSFSRLAPISRSGADPGADLGISSIENESVWRAPPKMYEQPPPRPVRISQRERREAIRFWKQAGVIDDRGQVAERWTTVVGALFG
jgi:hypothetical protein